MLYCHITSHVPTDPHQDLLMEKGGGGWPYLVFMDASGEVVHDFKNQVSRLFGYERTRKGLESYLALKPAIDAGKKEHAARFLLARIEIGQLEFAAAKNEIAKIDGASAELRRKLDASMLDLEIASLLAGSRMDGGEAAGERFLELKKAGKVPADSNRSLALPFWGYLLRHADSTDALLLYAESLSHMKKLVGNEEKFKPWFELKDKRLEELEKKAKGGGKD